jgi:hypothetical protein
LTKKSFLAENAFLSHQIKYVAIYHAINYSKSFFFKLISDFAGFYFILS